MKLNEEDKALLEQWLEDQSFLNWANQLGREDMLKWEHYFNEHAHHWELAKIGRTLVLGISFKDIPTENSQAPEALSRLLDRLDNKPRNQEMVAKTKKLRLGRSWQLAAAIATILLVSGFSYYQFFHHTEVLITTSFGQQLETMLPDGSEVILNANSSLRYNTENPRMVWLEGEAFFEIKKIPKTHDNFQVFTQDLKVTVLGTSFNVNARNEQTKVFLEEGKVDLEVDDSETGVIQMNPGDLIAYSKKQNKLKEQRNNASALENASWKEGTLVFKDTPLQEALYDIEDIYGIQFIIQSDQVKEELVSGGVPIKDLEVTLQTLSEVYDIKIRSEGKRYFITGKHE